MKSKLLKLECGCQFHQLVIEEFTIDDIKGTFLSLCIYEHKSRITGNKLNKPKLVADVMLHPYDVKLFKKEFINEK